ncbi:MAG: hypothetical protein R3B09_28245 [Nannocystaceae bacterium]
MNHDPIPTTPLSPRTARFAPSLALLLVSGALACDADPAPGDDELADPEACAGECDESSVDEPSPVDPSADHAHADLPIAGGEACDPEVFPPHDPGDPIDGFTSPPIDPSGLIEGPPIFHDTAGCTLSQTLKDRVVAGWNKLYGPSGVINTPEFRHRLARQLFDFNLQGAVAGASPCKSTNPYDTVARPTDFNYPVAGGFDGLHYWDTYLGNSGPFPAVSNGATAFNAATWGAATAAEFFYSIVNTNSVPEFYCMDSTTMSAGPLTATTTEKINLGDKWGGDVDYTAWTIIHESIHNRHFDHQCGRPTILTRTASNTIDVGAAEGGWSNQAYASTTPSKAVEINAYGAVQPVTLLDRWQADANGDEVTEPVTETGPYVNSWTNTQLLPFKGYDQVRLYFGTLSTEPGFDTVEVLDHSGGVVATYSGEDHDFWTPWIQGPNVRIRFTSDASIPQRCATNNDCTFGSTPVCGGRGVCTPSDDTDKSYMGYEIITFEGRGVNNEHLTDLYRDVPYVGWFSGWDWLYTYIRTSPTLRFLKNPNYIEAPPLTLAGSSKVTNIFGTLNANGDRDVFRFGAPVSTEGWPDASVDYKVTLATKGSTDTFCRLYWVTLQGANEILSDDDGGVGTNCMISTAIARESAGLGYYFISIGGYDDARVGDYELEFVTEVLP